MYCNDKNNKQYLVVAYKPESGIVKALPILLFNILNPDKFYRGFCFNKSGLLKDAQRTERTSE